MIDGKQRLMTIAGFYLERFRSYWVQPEFSGLAVLENLNRVNIDAFHTGVQFAHERRQLANADIRTAVITGFSDENVLYDVFYRINTGSVPLSSQELRQVLNRGEFAKRLIEITSAPNPLWDLLRINAPDPRLRDVELLLRLVAWRRFSATYVGNMKPFLDQTMDYLNKNWKKEKSATERLMADLLAGAATALSVYGETAGRKFKENRFERSLNRVVLEVQVHYFSFPAIRKRAVPKKKALAAGFRALSEDPDFLTSLEQTTKSIENYKIRFDRYGGLLHQVLGVKVNPLPLGHPKKA